MPNWKKVIVSGSDAVLNNITATGNVTIQGDLTAENYIISSTTMYMTQSFSDGSTIFGDTLGDTHEFTGSLYLTGTYYDDTPVTDGVLAIDTATGRVYYTGSYGDAGGGISITNDGLNRVLTSNNDGTINAESEVTYNGALFNIAGGSFGQSTNIGRAIRSDDGGGLNRIQLGDVDPGGNRTLLDVDDNLHKITFTTFGNTGTYESYITTASIHLSGSLNVHGATDGTNRHIISGGLEVTDFVFSRNNIQALNNITTTAGNVVATTGDIQATLGSLITSDYVEHYNDANTYMGFPSVDTIHLTAGGTTVHSMKSDRASVNVPFTASSDISASGFLFASTSNAAGNYNSVVVVDTASGQFYYTSSYGSGGETTLPGGDRTYVQFSGSTGFEGDSGLTWGAQTNTLRAGTSAPQSVGSGWGLQSGSHFLADNLELVTNARVVKWNPQALQSENYVFVGFGQGGANVYDPYTGTSYNPGNIGDWLGAADGNNQSPILSGLSGGQGNFEDVASQVVNGGLRIGGIYANYRTNYGWSIYANQFVQPPGSPGIAIRNGGIELYSSESYAGDPEGSGSLASPRASASAVFTLASDSSSLLIQVGKEDLRNIMFISHSGGKPFIGVGTQDPKATFDIKDVEDSAQGTRFLLKSSRTTTGAQVGDSAGSINFAIDSASFDDIFSSGSVASIDSKVRAIDTSDGGTPNVAGNIIFKSSPEWIETLNEVAEIGHFHFDNLNPSEDSEPGMHINGQLTVGSGSTWQSAGYGAVFSVYNSDNPGASAPNLLKFRVDGSHAVIHSGSLTIGSGSISLGETYSGANQVEVLNLRGQNSIKLGHISGGGGNHGIEFYASNTQYAKLDVNGNFGIGTTQNTAPEKLTVEGNISASGDLTANNGSFSGDLTVDGNITANQYIVSSSVTYMTQSFSSGSTIFGDTLDDTHQFTGSVDITGSLTVDGITYPTTDGNNGDVLITDGAGNLSFTKTTVYANVKNVHGSELVKGMPVHVTGAAGNTSEVVAASASNAATMPAHFILNETLADDAEGLAIAVGYINGVNTGDFSEGDTVYVGANGGYTNAKPTGSNLIQNLGIVDKVHASNGSGFILGAGRSNDVPNITPGYVWVGNNDSVATAVATSSLSVATASFVEVINGGSF